MVSNQAYLFMVFTIVGVLIGIVFDIFRVSRKLVKTKDIITNIEDIIFLIISGIIVVYFMYNYSDGEIRAYMIAGIIIGFLMYLFTISEYVIKLLVIIIRNFVLRPIKFFNNILRRIAIPLIKILKLLIRTLYKFIAVICIKMKKMKILNITLKGKNIKKKFVNKKIK